MNSRATSSHTGAGSDPPSSPVADGKGIKGGEVLSNLRFRERQQFAKDARAHSAPCRDPLRIPFIEEGDQLPVVSYQACPAIEMHLAFGRDCSRRRPADEAPRPSPTTAGQPSAAPTPQATDPSAPVAAHAALQGTGQQPESAQPFSLRHAQQFLYRRQRRMTRQTQRTVTVTLQEHGPEIYEHLMTILELPELYIGQQLV